MKRKRRAAAVEAPGFPFLCGLPLSLLASLDPAKPVVIVDSLFRLCMSLDGKKPATVVINGSLGAKEVVEACRDILRRFGQRYSLVVIRPWGDLTDYAGAGAKTVLQSPVSPEHLARVLWP